MDQHTCDQCILHFIDLGTTKVCPGCGIETKKPLDTRSGANHWHDSALLYTHYSRLNRFVRLMDSVILPSTTKKDERMLQYLFDHKKEISSVKTLLLSMQRSKLQNKRYNNLHIFHKLFIPNYKANIVPHNYHYFKKHLIRRFRNLEFAHKKLQLKQFFNYYWLLRYFFKMETEYIPYLRFIKKIKCKKRCQYYERMMDQLIAVIHV